MTVEQRTYVNAAEFNAKPERRWSVEWDFGVMWAETEHEDGRPAWPVWRVSWIIDTGELYATTGNDVIVLGTVPRVGIYPHGDHSLWTKFKDAQDVEKVMDGWAEGPPHKPLSWIEERLRRHGFAT